MPNSNKVAYFDDRDAVDEARGAVSREQLYPARIPLVNSVAEANAVDSFSTHRET